MPSFTWTTRYPSISRCLFLSRASPLMWREFLQKVFESRKSTATLKRKQKQNVTTQLFLKIYLSKCWVCDVHRWAPGGSSPPTFTSELVAQRTLSDICSVLGSLKASGCMCLSSMHSKSEMNQKHTLLSFSECESRGVNRSIHETGSKLTNSVKIRCDHCNSNTIDAIKDFTQHFVDALLRRADSIVTWKLFPSMIKIGRATNRFLSKTYRQNTIIRNVSTSLL